VVNFAGPHGPFDVTRTMRSRWEDVEIPPPVDNPDDEGGLVSMRRQNYAAMIENIDWHIGSMIAVLRERGELDDTIIVYASDHGEMLGDHGKWGKCLWYTPSASVPLIIAGPGIPPGRVSDALVCLQDLAATFLDYGEARPIPDMEAISLRAVLEGRTEHHREFIQSGLVGGPYNWKMVFDGRFKLVLQPHADPILYDLEYDPNELKNCIAAHPEAAARLARQLGVDFLRTQ
jgi:arylsulfatase A-like enzyme